MTQQTSLNLEHCEAVFPSAIYVAEVENLRAYCAKYRLQMSFSHPPGVAFPIESRGAGAIAGHCVLQWNPLPEGAKCLENEKRITESGAVSIALLMIHLLTDFELAAVPEEGAGFDFVLRRKGANGVENRQHRLFLRTYRKWMPRTELDLK